MHCHLLIPSLLPPGTQTQGNDPLHDAPAPALEILLARGLRARSPHPDMESWLCETFGVARGQDYPLAPLSLLAEGIQPGGDYWLRADPVYLNVERDQLILTEASTLDLSREEADILVAALNRHFSPDGLNFVAPSPWRWYLRAAPAPSIATRSLYQAAGNNIHPLLPTGPDAMRWRALLNEVQMLLFEHPANIAREARGAAPINSVWPWGGGIMPDNPRAPFQGVWADIPLARGLAQATGVAHEKLPGDAREWLRHGLPGEYLLVLDALRPAAARGDVHAWRGELARLERDWFAPLKQAVEKGDIYLTLHLPTPAGTLDFAAQRAAMWKLWRHARPLSHYRP